MGWFNRLKQGWSQVSHSLSSNIRQALSGGKLDAEMIELLHETLIMGDVSSSSADHLIGQFKREAKDKDPSEYLPILAHIVTNRLAPYAKPLLLASQPTAPQVVMMCGVNGNGKTTTIGKLSAQWQSQGLRVMVAACDTFRAAAVEQLQRWAERVECGFFSGKEGSDPASVAFGAYEAARDGGYDILLIDTAGRLHTNDTLMEELAKIKRVLQKHDATCPHHVIMVLDGTTGQNASRQCEIFDQKIGITGLIITKLDSSAKGGIVITLAERFKKPIHAVGIGEGVDDLRPFDAEAFASALVGLA